MSIVKEAFNTYAQASRRKFTRAKSGTVGASEIGQCARKIGYAKHDNPQDSNRNVQHIDGWGAARRGNTFENYFYVPAMRKRYGKKLLFTGDKQKSFFDKHLSATPDGMLVDQPRDVLAHLMVPDIGPSGCLMVECKTIDPRINLAEAKHEHVFQAHVQIGMVRKHTKYQPEYAVIVYTNASFFDDVVEFVVRFDPKIYEQAEKRAAMIINATSASELRPEGWIAGGKECEYCAFSAACKALRGPPDVDDAPQIDPQFLAEIEDLAREEKRWDTASSEALDKRREFQEKIKERLREKGLRKIAAEGISVVWSSVVGRPSFDMPKLKAAAAEAGFDIQQFERVGEPSDRLTIKVQSKDRLVKAAKRG